MADELVISQELTPTQEAIVEALRWGNTRRAAAQAVGIHHSTFYDWFAANPTFADACKKAEAEAEVRNVGVIQAAAARSWQAAAWWLERRRPKDWREVKTIDVRQLPNETLIALLENEAGDGGEAPGLDDPDAEATIEHREGT